MAKSHAGAAWDFCVSIYFPDSPKKLTQVLTQVLTQYITAALMRVDTSGKQHE